MSAAGLSERIWRPDGDAPERVPLRLLPGGDPDAAAPAALAGAGTAGGVPAGGGGSGGAAAGALEALLEQLHDVCASAVDPLEIAACLEFEGIGDTQAQRYGFDDVFALAAMAFETVPRRPVEPEAPPDPWAAERRSPVLHALCYGLPAIFFPAAGGLLRGPGALPVLVTALLVAWSATQVVGHLGYARLGAAEPEAAFGALRRAAAGAIVVVAAAVTGTALLTHAGAGVWSFALGEGTYMAGASVLLVLAQAGALLQALAPGVLASAAYLAAGRPGGVAAPLAWAALASTPVVTLVLSALRTRAPARSGAIRPSELVSAMPAAGFGLVAAGLLALPVVDGLRGRGGLNPGALLASLPISLSMGVGEWRLLWYRRRMRHLLRSIAEPARFAARARRALAAATGQYAAAAAGLLVLAAVVAGLAGLVRIGTGVTLELVAYFLLATAMFLALVFQALGARAIPLVLASGAVASELALGHLGAVAILGTSAGLLAGLAAYGLVELARAVRHAM